MKKGIIILTLTIMLSLSASAAFAHHGGHGEYRHRYYNNPGWHRVEHYRQGPMPFGWYAHYERMPRRHMERIYNHGWGERFPGTHAYRWRGDGFWHRGHYVKNAVLFFNDDNRLVSIGYVADGVFIHFREDNACYENRDSFFLSWQHN